METFSQEENIINLIREKPFIYDKKNVHYKDTGRKMNAFTEIGATVGLSAEKVQAVWNSLRKQFTNYLAKLKCPSGSGAGRAPFFRHAGPMSFYQAVYKPYKSNSNIDGDDDGDSDHNEDNDQILNETRQNNAENDSFGGTGQSIDQSQSHGIQVEFSGFDNGQEPHVVLHQTGTGKKATTPTVERARHSKKRPKLNDDFNDRFFEAIEKTSEIKGDEFDHFGANLAARIRNVSSKQPRVGILLQLELQKTLTEFELRVTPDDVNQSLPK